MLKKNSKFVQQQSSESDISSQNQQSNQAKNKHIVYQNSSNDEELSDYQQKYQQDSQTQQEYQQSKESLIRQNNQQNSEQSQSQDQSEQEDSLDEGGHAYFRNQQADLIHTIREDPQQNTDQVDILQQRIKKLEKDLESRLDKYKKSSKQIKNDNNVKKQISSPPPIQKKKFTAQQGQNKMNGKTNDQKIIYNQNQSLLQKKNESKKQQQNIIYGQNVLYKQIKTKKQANMSIAQPKNEHKQQKNLPNKTKFKKQYTKSSKASQNNNQALIDNSDTLELQQKINQMAKIMNELKLQNQTLKQKLQSQMSKQQKSKSKTIKELQKIKEAASTVYGQNNKLQKQIQLLQVIEKIQIKLKKSISRKLPKQGNASSSLLHKGLPTSIQSYF